MSKNQVDLIDFSFQDNEVRVHMDNENNVWFLAKDVCDVLGLVNSRKAVSELEERESIKSYTLSTKGGRQLATFINEFGLYELIFKSRKPVAKKFRRWIRHDVLPSIRKTGGYQIQGKPNQLTNQLINNTQNLIEQTTALIEQIKRDKPYVELGKSIEKAEGNITVRQMANIIKQSGFDCGEKRLFDFLREMKYLFRIKDPNSKRLINQVYQKVLDSGLMVIKEDVYTRETEKGKVDIIYIQPLITTKGQLHILTHWQKVHNKYKGV